MVSVTCGDFGAAAVFSLFTLFVLVLQKQKHTMKRLMQHKCSFNADKLYITPVSANVLTYKQHSDVMVKCLWLEEELWVNSCKTVELRMYCQEKLRIITLIVSPLTSDFIQKQPKCCTDP